MATIFQTKDGFNNDQIQYLVVPAEIQSQIGQGNVLLLTSFICIKYFRKTKKLFIVYNSTVFFLFVLE